MHDLTDYIPYDDFCFVDCETRSAPGQDDPRWESILTTSTDRYSDNAWPIIITWAFGVDGPVRRWVSRDITRPPERADLPPELLEWDGYFAAWNSGFDRKILRTHFGPDVGDWLDMMAQASYNNMPLGLDRAAKSCGLEGKMEKGKALIKMFCTPDGATPEEQPEAWDQFCVYADVDVEQMQAVAKGSLPVPYSIWRELWTSERINDRGLPYDRAMAAGGAAIADAYADRLSAVMTEITGGDITSPKQFVRHRAWVWERVRGNPFLAQHMIIAQRTVEGVEEFVLKMDRPRITKMLAALETLNEGEGLTDEEFAVMQLLTEREYGASAAPAKFTKMLAMANKDGRLTGQYVFAGATQTGRYSSRGVQLHNMTNRPLGDLEMEEGVAFLMIDGEDIDVFAAAVGNVGKGLSLMIRPTITAGPRKLLVWGDWANVEARGLPWLAKAEKRLDVFRAIDADPENTPDVYLQAAAGMYNMDADKLLEGHKAKDKDVKGLRQKGKIAELALGFAGGAGALQSMAANYGMSFGADEAQDIVNRWRAANAWAVEFWDEVWAAFLGAVQNVGTRHDAGRVSYEAMHVGDQIWVACYLPDNRPIFYRNVRERIDIEYDAFDADVVVSRTSKLSFEGEAGVKFLWKGILVENVTQATCASILRETLGRLEDDSVDNSHMPVVGHTHDEIILEVDDTAVAEAASSLEKAMLHPSPWLGGLPLGADISAHKWYSKAVD